MRDVFVIRFAGVAAACALLLGMCTPTASATPAPTGRDARCTQGQTQLAHVVLFTPGTSRHAAGTAVTSACGKMLAYYPEIAVAVASGPVDDFAKRIGSTRVYSAGSVTRTPAEVRGGRAALPVAGDSPDPGAAGLLRSARERVSPGNADVVVAVLDSGVDERHPALRGSVATERSAGCLSGAPTRPSRPFAEAGAAHGTHVAGIITSAPDGPGLSSTAPAPRIAPVRVIDAEGATTPRAVVCGLMWAAQHDMAVANASFRLTTTGGGCVAGRGHPVVREAIGRAVEYATSNGTVVVAAATNQGRQLTRARVPDAESPPARGPGVCHVLPASMPGVVTVSALTATGVKAGYSSYGLGVIDVAAPGGTTGQCVRSTVPDGYDRMCGTSMAAAHVSGVLALLASTHPSYSAHQLIDLLRREADAKPCPADYDLDGDGRQDAYCTGYSGYNGFYGHGVVDAAATATQRNSSPLSLRLVP